MLRFLEDTIDSYLLYKHCSFGIRRGKQLSKDYEVGVDLPRFFDHVSSNADLRTMEVVHPKPIEVLRHFSDVAGHVLPSLWCVCWALSVSDS